MMRAMLSLPTFAVVLAVSAAVFLVDVAYAQQRGPGGEGARRGTPPGSGGAPGLMLRPAGLLFAGFDANGDYAVDAEEFEAGIARAFPAADADGSGVITPLEYADWAAKALGSREARPGVTGMDVNADAAITFEEFDTAFRDTFALYAPATEGPTPIAAFVRQGRGRLVERVLAEAERDKPDDGIERLPRR